MIVAFELSNDAHLPCTEFITRGDWQTHMFWLELHIALYAAQFGMVVVVELAEFVEANVAVSVPELEMEMEGF